MAETIKGVSPDAEIVVNEHGGKQSKTLKNKHEINGDITTVFVRYKGVEYPCLVDTDVFWELRKLNCTWCANPMGHTMYAVKNKRVNGKTDIQLMHRLILGLKSGDGKMVDHIDGNGLNNLKNNLRVATKSQNAQNIFHARSSTGYRNVYWDKNKKKYYARIQHHGKMINGGAFNDIHSAIQKAAELRRKYFEFSQEASEIA
jgi:hypothetical protein